MSDELPDESGMLADARERNERALEQIGVEKPISAKLMDAMTQGLGIGSAEAADLAPTVKPPGDDSLKNDFLAAQSRKMEEDPVKQFEQWANQPAAGQQAQSTAKPKPAKPKPKPADKETQLLEQAMMGAPAEPQQPAASPATPGAPADDNSAERDEDLGQPPQSIGRRLLDGLYTLSQAPKAILGMAEAATEMGTGFFASIPAIPLGIYKAIQEKDPQAFASEFGRIQQQLTESAQTDEGKLMMQAVSQLMEAYEKGVDWTIDRAGLDKYPLAAALVKGTLMVAPMLLPLARKGEPEIPVRIEGEAKGEVVDHQPINTETPTVNIGARAEPGMGEAGDVTGPGATEHAAEPTPESEAAAATPEPALKGIVDMEDELPWKQPSADIIGIKSSPWEREVDRALRPLMKGEAVAPEDLAAHLKAEDEAKQFVRTAEYLGWPSSRLQPDNPLALPDRTEPIVTIPDDIKERWGDFLAQQRGEKPAPLEANEQPLAGQRSADFSATGSNPVKINLNMIDGPADLKDALARISETIPAQEVRSNEAALMAADGLGMTAEDFLESRVHLPLTDAETLALRSVTNAVGLKLARAAGQAARVGASPEDHAVALALYAKAHGLIQFFEQAKVQAGRSVQSFGIPLEADRVPYADAVRKITESVDPKDVHEFMSKLAQLTDENGQPDPVKVMRFVNAAPKMTPRDWFMYGWYNTLFGVKTVVKKLVTDAIMPIWNLAERYQAETMAQAAPSDAYLNVVVPPEGAAPYAPRGQGVAPGETAQMFVGYVKNFTDAVRMGGKGLLANESQFARQFQYLDAMGQDRTSEVARAGSLEDMQPGRIDQPTATMLNYIKAALPTSWIAGVSDFAKYWNYGAEKQALVYREGVRQGLDGKDLETYRSQTLNVLPESMHRQAMARTLQSTFEEPLTGLAAHLRDAVDAINIPLTPSGSWQLPLGRILMPVVRVPTNFYRFAYRASPLPIALRSSAMRDTLSKPGAERDLAIARMTLGTGVILAMSGYALNGQLTGRGPASPDMSKAAIAAGRKKYWFNPTGEEGGGFGFNQIEPFGSTLGVIGDTMDIMKFTEENQRADLATSLALGIGESMLSKSYMQSAAQFFDALESPDVKGSNWMNQWATSWIPSDVRGAQRAQDPWMRAHYEMMDAIEAKIPYLSQGLPFKRTMWGDPIPLKAAFLPLLSGSGTARWVSSIPVSSDLEEIQPIDTWKWEHRMDFPNGAEGRLNMVQPGRVQSFPTGSPGISAKIQLSPELHDRLIVLTGNELKQDLGGGKPMGAKDTLNALVQGQLKGGVGRQWDGLSPNAQALAVVTIYNDFARAAKQKLLQENPELQDQVKAWAQFRGNQLQPQGVAQ